jgi:calmodulin
VILLNITFAVLKKAFDAFDREKNGYISTDMIGTIFEMLGIEVSDEDIEEIIEEVDSDGTRNIHTPKIIIL